MPNFQRDNSRNQVVNSVQMECNSSRVNFAQEDKLIDKPNNPATEIMTPSDKKQLSLLYNSKDNPNYKINKEENIL